jgi:hypothetical protein
MEAQQPKRYLANGADDVYEALQPSELEGLSAADLLAKIEADGWIVGRHVAQDPAVYGTPEGCGDIVCGELAELTLIPAGKTAAQALQEKRAPMSQPEHDAYVAQHGFEPPPWVWPPAPPEA